MDAARRCGAALLLRLVPPLPFTFAIDDVVGPPSVAGERIRSTSAAVKDPRRTAERLRPPRPEVASRWSRIEERERERRLDPPGALPPLLPFAPPPLAPGWQDEIETDVAGLASDSV